MEDTAAVATVLSEDKSEQFQVATVVNENKNDHFQLIQVTEHENRFSGYAKK